MPGQRIRWDYDQLDQIAQQFSHQAETTRATLNALKRQMDVLNGGDWIGTGANAFYNEMNSAVLPALQRLAAAMDEAARTTLQIKALSKAAEDDAARILIRIIAGRALNLDVTGADAVGNGAGNAGAGSGGGSSGGILGGVGDFLAGAWEEGKGMLSGLAHMVIHPIDTAMGLAYGVTHPGELWDALKKPYVDDWNSGHPWRAVGRGALFIGSMLIGTHGADKAAKAVEAAELARMAEAAKLGDAARLVESGRLGEAAKVADAARIAEATSVGEGAEAAKVSEVAGAGRMESPVVNDIIGKDRVGSALKDDLVRPQELPFENYRRQAVRDFPPAAKGHGWPDIVDNFAGDAKQFELNRGAKLYQLKGTYNGQPGRFEWIIQDGNVTHRQFVHDGTINGIPIRK